MLSPNLILRFLLFFTLIYTSFLLFWPALEQSYNTHFRSVGKIFFSSFRENGTVWFEEIKKPQTARFSTNIKLINKKVYNHYLAAAIAAGKKQMGFPSVNVTASSWYIGFLPSSLLISLILATPIITFYRKIISLIVGLLLMYIFILLQLWILIYYEFMQNDWLAVVYPGPFAKNAISSLHYLFVESMGTRFILPVFLWILVTFKKEDVHFKGLKIA